MDLTEADHDLLDDFIEAAIARYHQGYCTLREARADIMEPVTLIARGNESFRQHIKGVLADWGGAAKG